MFVLRNIQIQQHIQYQFRSLMLRVPNYQAGSNLNISPQGFKQLLMNRTQSKYPGQHVMWTDDIRVEIPIRVGKEGVAALPPSTLIDQWKTSLELFSKVPALSVKVKGNWVTLNYKDYYEECVKFAKGLIALGVPQFAAVNIIGLNAPEWLIAFFGTVFARCIPVGIYTTNNVAACEYIALHSEAKIVVAENRELAKKYLGLLEKGEISKIILYNDQVGQNSYGGKIVHWTAFQSSGKSEPDSKLQERQKKIKPGQCCTLVYTSGTTGMPKGVMLSHDNCTWTPNAATSRQDGIQKDNVKIVSYLPFSHAAALYLDGLLAIVKGAHIYFADAKALQGTLISTLQEVRPQIFLSMPRIWEKIYTKLKQQQGNKTGLAKKILNWAQSIGIEGTVQQAKNEPTSWQFKLAKRLVFNKVKRALGLDQVLFFSFGSAPLDPAIRKYFLSMNIHLRNSYGMTECTAPQSQTHILKFNPILPEDYLEVGQPILGVQTKIKKEKETDAEGEICMRGRNVFMGYLKNAQETSKTIDPEGYLHSGDLGRISKEDYLFITGRAKELIITAGGENIPPILIENQIKNALPCLANAMVVGDHRNYLTCLISLLEDPPQSGNLEKNAAEFLASRDCNIKTTKEARSHPNFSKVIMLGLKEANKKAISRAQMVQNFYLMPQDFSVENGTLTPNLKLKRKEALNRFAAQIEQMYSTPKL